jgi:hypothetical protein
MPPLLEWQQEIGCAIPTPQPIPVGRLGGLTETKNVKLFWCRKKNQHQSKILKSRRQNTIRSLAS